MVDPKPADQPFRLRMLSDDQIARLGEIRDEWLGIYLATGPTDRERAQEAIECAYQVAGFQKPKRFVWVQSPKEGSAVADILVRHAEHGLPGFRETLAAGPLLSGPIGRQMLTEVRQGLRGALDARVLAALTTEITDGIPSHRLFGHLSSGRLNREFLREGEPVGLIDDSVADEWCDAVQQMLIARNGGPGMGLATAMARARAWNLGRHPSGLTGQDGAAIWACFAALVEFGAPGAPFVTPLMTVARHTSWWWPFEHTVVVSERPVIHRCDSELRLHSPDGPALAYADGTSVWAWHGRRVPPDLILHEWDARRILVERNAEVRRCAIEKLGWHRFIADGGFRQVGGTVDDPGNPGCTLSLYDVPEGFASNGAARLLVCTNGTPEADGERRTFGLTVPAQMRDPLAAAAWTFDLEPAEYAALIRAS